MSNTIIQQIEDLQAENERLKFLDRLLDKAIKAELGFDRKSIKKIIKNNAQIESDFEKKICNYFNLKTPSEMDEFLSIICSESTLNFFNNNRTDNKPIGDR